MENAMTDAVEQRPVALVTVAESVSDGLSCVNWQHVVIAWPFMPTLRSTAQERHELSDKGLEAAHFARAARRKRHAGHDRSECGRHFGQLGPAGEQCRHLGPTWRTWAFADDVRRFFELNARMRSCAASMPARLWRSKSRAARL